MSSTEGETVGYRLGGSEEGQAATGGGLEQSGADSIIAALGRTEGVGMRESRAVTITDEDRAAALRAQKKIRSSTRTSVTSVGGTDTDEETNEVTSSVSSEQQLEEEEEQREEDEGEEEREREVESEVQQIPPIEEERMRLSRASKKLSRGLRNSPALQFITRKDLYTFLNAAGVSALLFLCHSNVWQLRVFVLFWLIHITIGGWGSFLCQ